MLLKTIETKECVYPHNKLIYKIILKTDLLSSNRTSHISALFPTFDKKLVKSIDYSHRKLKRYWLSLLTVQSTVSNNLLGKVYFAETRVKPNYNEKCNQKKM